MKRHPQWFSIIVLWLFVCWMPYLSASLSVSVIQRWPKLWKKRERENERTIQMLSAQIRVLSKAMHNTGTGQILDVSRLAKNSWQKLQFIPDIGINLYLRSVLCYGYLCARKMFLRCIHSSQYHWLSIAFNITDRKRVNHVDCIWHLNMVFRAFEWAQWAMLFSVWQFDECNGWRREQANPATYWHWHYAPGIWCALLHR